MFRCVLGANIFAPIPRQPTRILDVGTGSGRWVIEVAMAYPLARVEGMDLSPPNPLAPVPRNSSFKIGDLAMGLDYPDDSHDLVHSRYTFIFN